MNAREWDIKKHIQNIIKLSIDCIMTLAEDEADVWKYNIGLGET